MPPAEKLLPEDTLAVVTAPDWGRLAAVYRNSAYGRFWSDPAMRPMKEHFISKWKEELLRPLERELGVSFDSYADLPQGQLTLALTSNHWQGNADHLPGLLLLLDTRNKGPLLRQEPRGLASAVDGRRQADPHRAPARPGVLSLSGRHQYDPEGPEEDLPSAV